MRIQFPVCMLIVLLFKFSAFSQQKIDSNKLDSSSVERVAVLPANAQKNSNYKKLIVPSILIGFGVVGLENTGLQELNRSTRVEINEHKPRRTTLDNYTQYAPAVIVYGLNSIGIRGKHNFKERTIIYATSQVIAAGFVLPLKHLIGEERPDGSNFASFPSGHTTTAFSSAQFMFREYRETNFWLAISGYSLATFTGVYRTLNNKHWVGDVVAGAGFGILSTEFAYWLYPKISPLFSGNKKGITTSVIPIFHQQGLGIGLIRKF